MNHKLTAAIFFLFFSISATFTQETQIPQELALRFASAKKSDNTKELRKIEKEMMPYLNMEKTIIPLNDYFALPPESETSGDWTNQDFQVTSSQVGLRGFRQIDMKQGEDGWIYLAAIVNNPSLNGNFKVWASSNGGHSWNNILNMGSSSYFFSISMTVESKNNAVGDSTRVIVFTTSGLNTNGNDTKVYFSSVRRDGSSLNTAELSPSTGKKYTYVSACSDGAYYSGNTYFYIVASEFLNDNTFSGLRMFKSTDWGNSFSSTLIATSSAPFDGDYYPSAAFYQSPNNSMDSVFIAVERLWDFNSAVMLIKTPVTNTGDFRTTHVNQVFINTNCRPSLTIAQQNPAKKILITYTYNSQVHSCYSTNSGSNWVYETENNTGIPGFTWCSSDTNSLTGNNFVMSYSNQAGDTITIKKGTPGDWLTTVRKVNNLNVSNICSPVSLVYRSGNSHNAAIAFAGSGNNGLYFDNEIFITGIQNINSNTPSSFSLEQNYPNPFNPVTNIRFSIYKSGFVTLKVYDIKGSEVAALVNMQLSAGSFEYDFNAANLPSGAYFYRLTAGDFSEVKKMILIK